MTIQTRGTPTMYPLLIGVDCYLPNRLPDGGYYASLADLQVAQQGHLQFTIHRTLPNKSHDKRTI